VYDARDAALAAVPEEAPEAVKERPLPPDIARYVDLFSGERRSVVHEHAELSKDVSDMIESILREKGIPKEILTVAFIESRFNPTVRSPRGDTVGLWQLAVPAARQYGLVVNRHKDERKDPVKATRAAAQMLLDLREHFGNWPLALAAYNSGLFRVEQAIRDSGGERSVFNLAARGLLSRTTRDYLAQFAALTLILGDPERYGFTGAISSS
jgi:membrane-bound lytic murein transglycosylase D